MGYYYCYRDRKGSLGKFPHLFKSSTTAAAGFAKIQGYEDLKDIVRRALDSEENYNLLFIGTPASEHHSYKAFSISEKTAYISMVQTSHPGY